MSTTRFDEPATTTSGGLSLSSVRPRQQSALAELWNETVVFTSRNLQHIRQVPEKLLDVTLQPLMFILLFAYVFGGAINTGGASYKEYLVGGILIQSLTFGMMGPGTSIATDLTEGVIDRFRSLPSTRAAYLLGHYAAEALGLMFSVLVLLGAGLAIGWRAHDGTGNLLLGILLLALFASAMIWVGTLIGLTVRSPDAVMGVGFIVVFPLTFISNAFVPIATMPTALQWFAAWNPISAMVAAVRTLFGNPVTPISVSSWPLEHPVPAAFIFCFGLIALAVPLSLARYRARTTD
jgi:ABC-2 type transport system permease protein